MTIALPPDVNHIINTLQSHNHEAYTVGGCVRDSIMGILPKDWDIATSALPHEVAKTFPRTVETGVKHGTITVLVNHQPYEVTTYRIDGKYLDNRRPENVTFSSEINEDLSRRDFTINAIAYNPEHGFADPHNGKKDISRKIIRCVGSPEERFGEDALRMLRAVRFAGQLGFAVDKAALDAISAKAANLSSISAERIREELTRLLCSPHVQAVKLLETTGLLPYVLYGHSYEGTIDHTIPLLAACPIDPIKKNLRLAVFFAYSGTAWEKSLQSLRFDNKTIKEVSMYIRMVHKAIPHDRYEIKKHLRQMPQVWFENLLLLQSIFYPYKAEMLAAILHEAQDIHAKDECYTLANLSVKGNDLLAAGISPGKAIGDKLEELLDAVMREPGLNEKLRGLV